jgi:regulator of RNase E activity RraA
VFVNVLEAPADNRVVVVAGFEDATAVVGALIAAPLDPARGGA